VLALLDDGAKLKEAVAEIATAAGASKSDLYQLVLDRRKAGNS
jgi:16S rRNA C1402 (ribose-2'-O) methylase RsmI